MAKKMKPMSLSIDQETHEMLKKRAAAKNQKLSDFVRRLLGHFVLDKDDAKAVVLQIPNEALSSRENMDKWLSQRFNNLLNQFFPTHN